MKILSVNLKSILQQTSVVRCYLYTITFATGQILRLTDAGMDVSVGGQLYISTGPQISGAKFRQQRGVVTDRVSLAVLTSSADLIGGQTWSVAARSGALDGAKMSISVAFASDFSTPAEALQYFNGRIANVTDNEDELLVDVVSDDEVLEQPIPKLTFQAGCQRTLFDAGCGVARSAYQKTGSVSRVVNRAQFIVTLADPEDFYTNGTLLFLSGANSGVKKSVKLYRGGAIVLSSPCGFDIQPGDGFRIQAGCDKSKTTCQTKFNNVLNFKAFPFIPKPETMV
jgi:uncharacterized phage protein (TIGR02218 family)